jgi:hypothetical protein
MFYSDGMIQNVRRRLAAFVPALCLIFGAVATAQQGYRPPDLDKEIFDIKKVDLDKFDRSGLVSALISVGRDFDKKDEVDYEIRAHALAIASRLDKDNERLTTTLKQLKDDGETVGDPGDKERVCKRLASGIRALVRKKDNEDNQICAAYCVDIALRLDPKSESASKLEEYQEQLSKAGHKADWTDMLGKVIRHQTNPWEEEEEVFEKKEVTMPGGEAKSFARSQSRINGLVVRQLPGGKMAGAASAVNATALREDGQKGLLFTFNQDVGPMMGGSLEEVIKFLRVRYDATPEKVPDGFRIELGFQDKYVPKDGPSAATLFTLVLDSLFSGEELDTDFACTGDITADGQVQKIGGTAGKIRGATKRGCKIVGIPVSNGKEVADVLLLDGPQQLLDIQIFTMADFDEAHAISRKEKSPEVQETLDAFDDIAKVVKEGSLDLLKNPEVLKRLSGVVDKMSNHLSAKLLMEYGTGKNTQVLSLGGSFNELDVASSGIFRLMGPLFRRSFFGEDEDEEEEAFEITDEQRDEAKESVAEIKKLVKNIDPKLKKYSEAVLEVCEAVADGPEDDEKPKKYTERLKEGMEKVQSTRSKLQEDPAIMEEIMD